MKQKKCNVFCVVTHNHLFTPTFAAIFTRKSFSCENGQKLNNIMLYDVIKLLSKYPLPPKSKRWFVVQTRDTVHQTVILIQNTKRHFLYKSACNTLLTQGGNLLNLYSTVFPCCFIEYPELVT